MWDRRFEMSQKKQQVANNKAIQQQQQRPQRRRRRRHSLSHRRLGHQNSCPLQYITSARMALFLKYSIVLLLLLMGFLPYRSWTAGPPSAMTTYLSHSQGTTKWNPSMKMATRLTHHDLQQQQQQQHQPIHVGRYAYAFFLGACDPHKPSYRGNLFTLLMATYVLTVEHSTRADVVVWIQMAYETNATTLPPQDILLLETLGIQCRYMAKPTQPQTFYDLVMGKLQVFTMVEYDRIMFLDADVLPFCNLDYIMDLSMMGRLQPNILHAMYDDPVNAGWFVITPHPTAYQHLLQLVQSQAQRNSNSNRIKRTNATTTTTTTNREGSTLLDSRSFSGYQMQDFGEWQDGCAKIIGQHLGSDPDKLIREYQ